MPARKRTRRTSPAAAPVKATQVEFVLKPAEPWVLTRGWAILAVLIVLALYGARIADAHFGLLDDAVTLSNAKIVLGEPLSPLTISRGSGRFLPYYFWHYTVYYLVAGFHAGGFFLVHILMLGGTAWLMLKVAHGLGASRAQAFLAVLLLLTNPATVACYYTLSKGEPLQLGWLLAALALALAGGRRKLMAAGGCVFMGLLSKETSLALAPAAVTWGVLEWWREREGGRARRFLLAALPALAAYGAIFVVMKTGVAAEGTYASAYQLDAAHLRMTARDCLGWLLRHFAFAAPVLAALPLAWGRLTPAGRRGFTAGAVAWGAFFGIMLPWTGAHGYHFLTADAAMGFALAFLVPEMYALRRGLGGWKGATLTAAVAISGVLFSLHLANAFSDARAQLLMDRENARLVERLAKLPPGARVGWAWGENEVLSEAKLYLSGWYGRGDVQVRPFNGDHREWGAAGRYWVATPTQSNTDGLMIRLGVAGSAADRFGRAVEMLMAGRGEPKRDASESEAWLLDAGFQNALCRLKAAPGIHCQFQRPFVWSRTARFGWTVYEVSAPVPPPLRFARYRLNGVWEVLEGERVVHQFRLGKEGDTPVPGDFGGDGVPRPAVYRPSSQEWLVDMNLDGRAEISFVLPGSQAGDVPIVGDWNGDGRATPGLYRPMTGRWLLWNNFPPSGPPHTETIEAASTDQPLPVAWKGRAAGTLPGLQRSSGEVLSRDKWAGHGWNCTAGAPGGAQPVVADWSGFGVDAASFVVEGQLTPRMVHCGGVLPVEVPAIRVAPGAIYFSGTWMSPSSRR